MEERSHGKFHGTIQIFKMRKTLKKTSIRIASLPAKICKGVPLKTKLELQPKSLVKSDLPANWH